MSAGDIPGPAPRNPAIDLARAFAAFGVILLHCAPGTPAAGRVSDFFLNFCVPFFLLSSLYFFWTETRHTGDPSRALSRRLPRLLGPYAVWSAIYVIARVAKLALRGGPVADLLSPTSLVAIVGSGGAGVQLYFLPLLALAYVLAWIVALSLRRTGAGQRWILGGLLVVAGATLFQTQEGRVAAVPSATAKLAATYVDWAIWMMPVVLTGAALAAWQIARGAPRWRIGGCLLTAAVTLDLLIVFRLVPYVWRFHSLMLAALILTGCRYIEVPAAWARRLAPVTQAAFGVFLVHHLLVEFIEMIDRARGGHLTRPYTVGSLLLVGALTFAVSVAFTQAVRRRPVLSRLLLGH